MLHERIVTAAILLVVLLGALLAPSAWPVLLILSVAAAAALWEWLRLSLPEEQSSSLAIWCAVGLFVLTLLSGAGWLKAKPSLWLLGLHDFTAHGLTWLVVAIWLFWATAVVLRGQVERRTAGLLNSLFAVLAVWVAWFALNRLFLVYGAWFLVSFLAFVWAADIGAYFAGRRYGKHKLAPSISPGKTREGAIAGIGAAVLWLLLSGLIPGSFGAVLFQRWSWWAVLLLGVVLASLSIVGDLFESLLKRRAGRKDSSQLLPGHGGVYDRIDALLPVAPLALMLVGLSGS